MMTGMMKNLKMSGTKMSGKNKTLEECYDEQVKFQKEVAKKYGYNVDVKNIPEDNIEVAKYHMLALLEEAGELVKSDKRWKNYRNTYYDKQNKLEELSDCIITLFNVAMFSGISGKELAEALETKMNENYNRIRGA